MDFNALISELRSASENLTSEAADRSLVSSVYCNQGCKAIEKVSQSDLDYENVITGLWVIAAHLSEQLPHIKPVPSLSEVSYRLFKECAKAVLNVQWQNLEEDGSLRQNFLVSLASLHNKLLPRGFFRFRLFEGLSQNPWTHPTLVKVMGGEVEDEEEKEEVRKYIEKEDPIILQLRVDMMLQENCEEYALNLCTSCLQHPDLCSNLALRNKQLALLHSLGQLDKLQEECQKLSPEDAVRIIQQHQSPKSKKHEEVYTVLIQMFMVQNWIKPSNKEANKELLKIWICHQWMVDRERDRFKESVWAMAKLSQSTEQIVLFIDILREVCGDQYLQLYVDMCIFAINVDKSHMETSLKEGNFEAAAARRGDMASICSKLACLVHHTSNKVAKICALSAFALKPSENAFSIIGGFYGQGNNCCNKCGKDKKRDAGQINPATLYEVERLLNMLRPEYLNPDNTFSNIQILCRKFLQETLTNVQQNPHLSTHSMGSSVASTTQVEGPGKKKNFPVNKNVFEAISPQDVQNTQMLLNRMRLQSIQSQQATKTVPTGIRTGCSGDGKKPNILQHQPNKVTGMTADQRQQLITLNHNATLKNMQSKVDVKGPQIFQPRTQTVQRQPPFQAYAQQQGPPKQQQAQGKQTLSVTQIIQQALQQDPNALKRLVQQGNPHMMDTVLKLMNKNNPQSSTPQVSQPSAGIPRQQPLPTVSTLLKPQNNQVPDQSFQQRTTTVRTNLQSMPTSFTGSATQQRLDSFTQAKQQSGEMRRLMQSKLNNIQQKDISQMDQMSGARVIFNLSAGGTRPKTTVELAQEASLASLQQKQLLKQQQQQKSQSKEGNIAPQQKPSQVAGVRFTPGLHLNKSQQQQFLSAANKSTPSHQPQQGLLQLPGQSSTYSGLQQSNSALPTDELSGSILGIDDNTFSELLQDPCILANTFPDIEVEGLGDDRSKKPSTIQAPAISQQGQVKRTITFSTPPVPQQVHEFLGKSSTNFYPTGTTRYSNKSATPVNNTPTSALNFPPNIAHASLSLHRNPASGPINQNLMKNSTYYGLQDRVSAIGKAHPDNSILNRRTFPLEVIGKTPSASGSSNFGSISAVPLPSTSKANLPEKKRTVEYPQGVVKQEPASIEPSSDSSSSNNATYRCIICSLAFSQMDDLQEHVRSVCKPGLQSSTVYTDKLKQDRANSAKAGVDTNTVFQCLRCFELCISIKEHRLTCKRVPAVPSDIRKEIDKGKTSPRSTTPKAELQDNSYKVPELPLPFPYPSLNANAVLNSLSMTASKSPKSKGSVSSNSKNVKSENPLQSDPPQKHVPEKLPQPQYSEISGSGGSKFYRCKVCHQTLCSLESFLAHWKECVQKSSQKRAEEPVEPEVKPLVGDVLKGVEEVIASVSVGAFTDDFDSELEGSDCELLMTLKDPCKQYPNKGDAFPRKVHNSGTTSNQSSETVERDEESKAGQISEVIGDKLNRLCGDSEFKPRKEETEEEEEDFSDSESSDKDEEYNDGMSVEPTRQAPPRLRDRKTLKPIQSFINESFVSPYSKVELDKNRFRRKSMRIDLPEDKEKMVPQLENNGISTLKVEVKVEKLRDTSLAIDGLKEPEGKNEKPEEEHVCKLCNKSYKNNRILVQHFVGKHLQPYTVKTLADTSSYFCHLCQRIFSTFSHYMIHVPNHSGAIHGKMKALLEQKSSPSQWSQRIATQRGIMKGVLKKSGISPTALKSKKRATKSAVERLRKQSPCKMRRKGRKPCLHPALVREESSDDSSFTDFHSHSSGWHPGEGGIKDGLRKRRPRLARVAGSKSKASSSDDTSSRQATSVDEDYITSEDLESDSSPRQTRSRKRSGQSCSSGGDVKRRKLLASDSDDVESVCTDDSGRVTTRSSKKKGDGASQHLQEDLNLSKSSCVDNKVFATDYSSDSNLTSLELSQENNEYVVSKSGSTPQNEDGLENEPGHKVVVRSLSKQQKEYLRTCDLHPSVVLEQLPSDAADQASGQECQQKDSDLKQINANNLVDAKNEGVLNAVHGEPSTTKTESGYEVPAKPLSFMDSFMSYVSSNYPSSTSDSKPVEKSVVRKPQRRRSDVSKGADFSSVSNVGSESVHSVESSSSPLSNTDQEGSNHSSDQGSMADTEGSTISYCTNSEKDVEVRTSTSEKDLLSLEEKTFESEAMQDLLSKIPTRKCSVNLGERLNVNFLSSIKDGRDGHLENGHHMTLDISNKAVSFDSKSENQKDLKSAVTRACAVRLERSDLCDKFISRNQLCKNEKVASSINVQNRDLQKKEEPHQVEEKVEGISEHTHMTAKKGLLPQEFMSTDVSENASGTCVSDTEDVPGTISEQVNSRTFSQNVEFNNSKGKEISGETATVSTQEQNHLATVEMHTSNIEAHCLEMVKTEGRDHSIESEKKLVAPNCEKMLINSLMESLKGERRLRDAASEKMASDSCEQIIELNQIEKLLPVEQKEEERVEDLSGKTISPMEMQNSEARKTGEMQTGKEEPVDAIGERVVLGSERQNAMLEKIPVPEEKTKLDEKEILDSEITAQSPPLQKISEKHEVAGEVKETKDVGSLDVASVKSPLNSDSHNVHLGTEHKPEGATIVEKETKEVVNQSEMATDTTQNSEEIENLSQIKPSQESPFLNLENLGSSVGIDGIDLKTTENREETSMESCDRLGTFNVGKKCNSTQLNETCRTCVTTDAEHSSKDAQSLEVEVEPLDRINPDNGGEKLVLPMSESLTISTEIRNLELKESFSEETFRTNQAQADPAICSSYLPVDLAGVNHTGGLQQFETAPSHLNPVSPCQPFVTDSTYSINETTSFGGKVKDVQSFGSLDSSGKLESMVTTLTVSQFEDSKANENFSPAASPGSRTSEVEIISRHENTVCDENRVSKTKAKCQEDNEKQVEIGETVSKCVHAKSNKSETGMVNQALADFNVFTGPSISEHLSTPKKKGLPSDVSSSENGSQAAKQSESPKNKTHGTSPKAARKRSPAFSLAAFLTERLRPDQKNKSRNPVSPVSPLTSPIKKYASSSQLFTEANSKEISAGWKVECEKEKDNERKEESCSPGSSSGVLLSSKTSALLLVDYSSSESEDERDNVFISPASNKDLYISTVASNRTDKVVDSTGSETQIQTEEMSSAQEKESMSSTTGIQKDDLSTTDHRGSNLNNDDLSPNTNCDTQLLSSEKDPKQDKRGGSCIDLLSDESNVNPQEGRDACNNAELYHMEEHAEKESTPQSNMETENVSSNQIVEIMHNDGDTSLCEEPTAEVEARTAGGHSCEEEGDKVTCGDSSPDSEELDEQKNMEREMANSKDENISNKEAERVMKTDFEMTHNHEVDEIDEKKAMNQEFEESECQELHVDTKDMKHDSDAGEYTSDTDGVNIRLELVEDPGRHEQLEVEEKDRRAQLEVEEKDRHAQLEVDEKDRHAQLEVEEKDRHAQLEAEEKDRHAQLEVEEKDRHAQLEVEEKDRHAQLDVEEKGKEHGQKCEVESEANKGDGEIEVPAYAEVAFCAETVPASAVPDSQHKTSSQWEDFDNTQAGVLEEACALQVDNQCEQELLQESDDQRAIEVHPGERPDNNSMKIVSECKGLTAETSLEEPEKDAVTDLDQQSLKEVGSKIAVGSFHQTCTKAEIHPVSNVLESSEITEDRSIEDFIGTWQKTNAVPADSESMESYHQENVCSVSDDKQVEMTEEEQKHKPLPDSQDKGDITEDAALTENNKAYQVEFSKSLDSSVNEEAKINNQEEIVEQQGDLHQYGNNLLHQSESITSPEETSTIVKSNVEAVSDKQPVLEDKEKFMEELNEEEDLSDYDLIIEKDTTSRNSIPAPFLQSTTSKFSSYEKSFAAESKGLVGMRASTMKVRKTRNTAQVLTESALPVVTENRAATPEIPESPRRSLSGAKSLRNKVNSKQFVWEVEDDDSLKHVTGSAKLKAMHSTSKEVESSIAVLERKRRALREKLETESSPFTWDLEESPEKPSQSRTITHAEKTESQKQKPATLKEDSKSPSVSDESRKVSSYKFQRRKRTAGSPVELTVVAKRVRRTSDKKTTTLSPGVKKESKARELGKSSHEMKGLDSFIDICDSDVSFKRDSLTSEQISLLSGEKVSILEQNAASNENEKVKKRGRGRPRKVQCCVLEKVDNKLASENLNLETKSSEPKSRRKRRSKLINDQGDNESEKIVHCVKREMKDKQSNPASKRARNLERNNEDVRDPKLKKAGLIRVSQNNTNSDPSTPMTRSSDAAIKAFNQKSLRNRGVGPTSTPPSTPSKSLPHPRNGPDVPPSKVLPGSTPKSLPTSVGLSSTKVSTGLDKHSQAISSLAISQQQPAVARYSTKVSQTISGPAAASNMSNSTAVVKRRAPAKSERKARVAVKSKVKRPNGNKQPHRTTVYRVEPVPNSVPRRGHKAPLSPATKGSQAQSQTVYTPLASGMLSVKPKRESKLKWKISKSTKSSKSKSKAPITFKRTPT